MIILSHYRLSKAEVSASLKKFDTKAPFYSVTQETKFINSLMRNVFKYTKEEYTQAAFDKIWGAIEANGLLFIIQPDFGGDGVSMDSNYKADYVKALKRFFSPVFITPFDGVSNSAKLKVMMEYISQAIEQAGYDPEEAISENKVLIKKIALASMQILKDVQALNTWQMFIKFLRSEGVSGSLKGIDNDAFYAELMRNIRIYLWNDMPENAYTYSR